MAEFRSSIAGLSISMKIGGRTRYYHFTPKGRPYTYGYLYVSDADEVKALCSHPYYGSVISLVGEVKPCEGESVVVKKVYSDVRKTQDARLVLKSEYGYAVEGIRSKEDARRAAAELNISFPNL